MELVYDLRAVGDQQKEVDRFSFDFWPDAAAPIYVGRAQRTTSMRNGVEHSAAPLLVRFKDDDNVGSWRVRHEAARTQGIGAVNEHITKSKLWW
jgi:hypothetical protein